MPQSACGGRDVSPSLGNSHVQAYEKSSFKVPCCRKEYEKSKKYEERRRGLYWRKVEHNNCLQGKGIKTKDSLVYIFFLSEAMADVTGQHGLVLLHRFALPPYLQLSMYDLGLMQFEGNRLVSTILMHLATTVVSGARDWYRTNTEAPMANHLLPHLSAQDLVTHQSPEALWLHFKLQSSLTWQLVENGLAPCRPCLVYSGLGFEVFFKRVYPMINQLCLQLYTSVNQLHSQLRTVM